MRRIGRLPIQLVITAVLATALAFVTPVFVHRNEYSKAVVDYAKNPNSENDANLRVESAKNQRVILRTHIVAAGVLFVLMNAGYFVARRWPRESKAPG
jgi:ABC-type spermidine/putrescine transport system permease subunit I